MSELTPPSSSSRRRRATAILTALLLVLAVGVAGPLAAPTAGAAATDGPAAAAGAAGWLAARVSADGSVPDALGDPSPTDTLQTAVSLAAAGIGYDAFHRSMTWLAANVDTVTGTGAATNPGQIGYLLIAIDAAGGDATNFGGVDLVARLTGTLGGFEPGLYGAADPTFDGVFRQGLALIGLEAAGVTPPSAAVQWLTDQQCGTSDPTIRGGWEAYRLLADACTAGSTVFFSGVDTNSTAVATSALAAVGTDPTFDPQPWFSTVQNTTGGWGFLQGLVDDPNSTAVVIQAITAAGSSATEAPFVQSGGDPLSSLLGFQVAGGAFTYPGADDAPNAIATEQAIWGAMPRTFPLGLVTFADAPVAPTTTTTTTPSSATPATPIETTSNFTG